MPFLAVLKKVGTIAKKVITGISVAAPLISAITQPKTSPLAQPVVSYTGEQAELSGPGTTFLPMENKNFYLYIALGVLGFLGLLIIIKPKK